MYFEPKSSGHWSGPIIDYIGFLIQYANGERAGDVLGKIEEVLWESFSETPCEVHLSRQTKCLPADNYPRAIYLNVYMHCMERRFTVKIYPSFMEHEIDVMRSTDGEINDYIRASPSIIITINTRKNPLLTFTM